MNDNGVCLNAVDCEGVVDEYIEEAKSGMPGDVIERRAELQ
ncbi:MAG TPA: hypothetical protein VFI27_10055 [candidate division Zixibacteria bacterium]|nr:hypothetical protein [candidate division Zixibacteria bacterium]